MGNLENLNIGDCNVFIDSGSGEVDLGHTKGGVEFSFEREFTDLTADQHGTSPVDMALTGNNLMIKTMLAEPTTENIANAIPEGLFTEGQSGDGGKVGLGRDSGYLLGQDSVLLRLHPRKNDADDLDNDIYIWKAVSVETIELGYKIDEQRILTIAWRALVDDSQPDGQRLGRVGDQIVS